MSRRKPKIETGSPSGGLQNPFDALDASGLPEGEVPVESVSGPREEAEKTDSTGERLVLRKEKAHRGGKTVIVISGFSDPDPDRLSALAHDLKRACGTGGTVKECEIEIQGEKSLELAALLRKRGYRVVGLGA
jgi:translation initiation factor 1